MKLYGFTSRKRFCALVIGIDSYQHVDGYRLRNLNGCVADAKDVALFIHEQYFVPYFQITVLLNEQATRANIKQSIQDFVTLECFDVNDAFVIYFAGHGAQVKSPQGSNRIEQSETAEMLIPYDFAPWTSDQENEQGIPNSTLVPLLAQLTTEKGPNLIVILDCCHSAFITRVNREGVDDIDLDSANKNAETHYAIRSVQLPEDYTILPSIDRDVLERASKPVWLKSY
ncbi:caspase domain-containing protein [Armillaria nabsnona]|nr:caspase domain-containing protein [Armillaria nabsnona]